MAEGTATGTTVLLRVRGLQKSFGAVRATDGLDLDVRAGGVHALIGPNGAGKSTLIAQLAGEIRPDAGTILFAGRDISRLPAWRRPHLGLARSFQITSLLPEFSAADNVALAVQSRAGHSFSFWGDARRQADLRQPALAALAEAGLAARAETPVRDLAHGEQRQLELAMAMALRPALLLLDEPMAGMAAAETRQMVEILRRLSRSVTLLLVEHDMGAVFSLADRLTVLAAGKAIATGTPAEIRANPLVRQAYLGDDAPC